MTVIDIRKIAGKAKKAIKKSALCEAKAKEELNAFKDRRRKGYQLKKNERDKANQELGGVKFRVVAGVKVVNILDWVTENLSDDSDKAIFNWCQLHKAYFYSRTKDLFDLYRAVVEAQECGRSVVMVEEV